jgi:hypothetical protein
MIVVRIHGGLGNQLFQYAVGRHLSLATRQGLALDVGFANPDPLGAFGLTPFRIVGRILPNSAHTFWLGPVSRVVERVQRAIPSAMSMAALHRVFIQQGPRFDDRLLKIRGSAYLVGNWQSFKYFSGSGDVLARELQLGGEADGENAQILAQIRGSGSVGVHVRRGDYVRNPKIASAYAVCDTAYYERAREIVLRRRPDARFFVFSDEIEHVSKQLGHWARTTFVGNNPPSARHEDFRLLTNCRDFIVANSSFSWWAAWLGRDSEKTVVAPAVWANDPEWDTDDIVPPDWIRA